MNTNEKVSQGTAIPERDTNENLQSNLTPDYGNCQEPVNPVIQDLVELAYRTSEVYEKAGALHIGCGGEPKVQMDEENFFDMFSFGECQEDYMSYKGGFDHEYDKYYTTVQGVEFFCLVEKGEPK